MIDLEGQKSQVPSTLEVRKIWVLCDLGGNVRSRDGVNESISYSHFLERIQLLRPIDLNMGNIFCRKGDVEELIIIRIRHLV